METTTLKNLLSENNPYGISGITIPRIQRAYAQGRSDAHAVKTRERFLSAIHNGLINNGLTLDFIYGNIQNGQLIPLDGQQRLTTLWLLHWYADKKESINDKRLARFSEMMKKLDSLDQAGALKPAQVQTALKTH